MEVQSNVGHENMSAHRGKTSQLASLSKKDKALSDVKNTLHVKKTTVANKVSRALVPQTPKTSASVSKQKNVPAFEIFEDEEQFYHDHSKCESSNSLEGDLAHLRLPSSVVKSYSEIMTYLLPNGSLHATEKHIAPFPDVEVDNVLNSSCSFVINDFDTPPVIAPL